MKVAAVIAPGQLGIQDVQQPVPGEFEALLEVERVGVCGSDLHFFPIAPESAVLGHEFVGRIVEVGSGVSRLEVGDRVCSIPCIGCGTCSQCLNDNPIQCEQVRLHGSGEPGMGAFGQFILVGENECFPLPEDLPVETAALIEPLAVGLHLVERARIGLGDRIVVLGAGPIGLTVVLWARHMGVIDIMVSDPVASRRELAIRLGATLAVDPTQSELPEQAVQQWGELPAVVIECMGRPGRLDIAAELVTRDGRVILGGMLFEPEELNSMTAFMKGISMEFVVQYTLTHFRYTATMLAQKRIDPSPLISADISLEELPEMMQSLMQPNPHCKVLVSPNRQP